MKLATFLTPDDERPRAGEVRGEHVVAFDDGSTVLDRVRSGAGERTAGAAFGLAEVTLLAPHEPRAIFATGLTYPTHALQGAAPPPAPVVFLKPPAAVAGPHGALRRPAPVTELDYEGELTVVMGAERQVAGYAVANDLTARDLQRDERQWARAKGFDDSCPFGPWVTTADEIADPPDLALRTWVNGDLRQDGRTSELLFSIAELIAYIGETCTLAPGDLILTGTPGGVGMSFHPPRYLERGDVVRVEIEGLGAIENTIA